MMALSWALIIGGIFLVWSAVTNRSPLDEIRSALGGA